MILLEDLLAGATAANARVAGEVFSREFEGFAHDSRNVRGGEMFVAVRTERADGHDFIPDACRRGVAGVLCERARDEATLRAMGVTCVAVDDVRRALRDWARYVLRRQAPATIAVTGSVGKTCTTKAIAAVLRHAGDDPRAVFENDNFNDLFGLPISLSRLLPAHQTAVLELASDSAGEIAALCDLIAPHWGVITNVAPAHLEHFGSLERLAHEYGALADAASERLFLNADDPLLVALGRRHLDGSLGPDEGRGMNDKAAFVLRPSCFAARRTPITWFGCSEMADARASGLRVEPEGVRFTLRWRGKRTGVSLRLLGRHGVSTALAAAAVALERGCPLSRVAEALTTLEPPPGRLRRLRGIHNAVLLDDTFSASLPSLLAALDALEVHRPPRIVVLGEVGDLRDRAAVTQVGASLARAADDVVGVGDGAEAACRAAEAAGLPAAHVAITHTVEDAVARVSAWVGGALLPGPLPTAKGSDGAPVGASPPGRLSVAEGGNLGAPLHRPAATVLVKGSEKARLERVVERLLADRASAPAVLVRQAPGAKQVVPLHQDRAAWMEVDLGAIAANLRRLREIASPAGVLAVLKADAYGHGAVRVARTAVQHGAAMLGAAVLSEAATLRAHGITAPILVLGYTPAWQARDVVRLGVAVSLYSLELAQHLSRAALALDRPPVPVHIKIDTGMHRLGLPPEEVVPFGRAIAELPGIAIEGLFTHFATADDVESAYALLQLERFERVLAEWQAAGLPRPRFVHAANSAAMLRFPQARFDLVRTGIALFGLHPSADVPCPPDFRPALALKTQLAQVHELPPGEPISYGGTWTTSRHTRIGVLPVGYADGFRRAPSHWGEVLVRGRRVPIVGRVCMDMCLVDVTDVPGARIGDEVVLIGEQGGERITAEAVAARLGTINYEVVSQILARVPRETVSH